MDESGRSDEPGSKKTLLKEAKEVEEQFERAVAQNPQQARRVRQLIDTFLSMGVTPDEAEESFVVALFALRCMEEGRSA
jgi:hypothetical protein